MHPSIVTRTDYELLALLGPQGPLARKLARSSLVPADRVPVDVVTMNSRVRIDDAGVHRHAKLVCPQQADSRGRISVLSPLGTVLLGMSAGQETEAEFPGGARRRIRVEEVVSQPEREMRRLTLDQKLDEALKQTFPASDAFAFSLGF